MLNSEILRISSRKNYGMELVYQITVFLKKKKQPKTPKNKQNNLNK